MSFYGKVLNYITNVFHKIQFINDDNDDNGEISIIATDEATVAKIKGDEWIQFKSNETSQDEIQIGHKLQSNSEEISVNFLNQSIIFDKAGHYKSVREDPNAIYVLSFDPETNEVSIGVKKKED